MSFSYLNNISWHKGQFLISNGVKVVRNGILKTIVYFTGAHKGHDRWELQHDKGYMLRYSIYKLPFSLKITVSDEVNNLRKGFPFALHLLPEWFKIQSEFEDVVPYSGEYRCFLMNRCFTISRGEKFYQTREVDDRFLEIRLVGRDHSLFKHHYPLGIDITEFGQLLFKNEDEKPFKLYEVMPFILYHATGKKDRILPYPLETLELSLLEDFSFEVFILTAHDLLQV